MKRRAGGKLIFVLFTILFFSCAANPMYAEGHYPALITAVIDGDTVKISFTASVPLDCKTAETVRLIGVNTPEITNGKNEYYGKEARDFTNQFWRKNIYLRFDTVSARRDKYNRILCYVYISELPEGNNLLNQLLIEGGYGKYYPDFPFESNYMEAFIVSEVIAKINKRGMWK